LLAHGGLLFVISICLYYALSISIFNKRTGFVKKIEITNLFRIFLMLFFIYFISNLITEYVFVTRNSFPIILLLSVLLASVNLAFKSAKKADLDIL